MADVASRSFGYRAEWLCKSNDELLTLFNNKFPLPTQSSWQCFQLSSAVVTKVIGAVQMKPFDPREWKQLPKLGTSISRPGASTCSLMELTRFWESQQRTPNGSITSQPLERWSGRENWAAETKSTAKSSIRRGPKASSFKPIVFQAIPHLFQCFRES